MKLWLDTETVGLQGYVKLIQYALDEGEVQFIPLYRGWENNKEVCAELFKLWGYLNDEQTLFIGFNISFDLYHLYRLFHKLSGYEYDSNARPIQPFKCKVLDLQVPAMLYSPLAPFAFNKGANRSVAVVRRVPRVAQVYLSNKIIDILTPLIPKSFKLKVGIHETKQKELINLSFYLEGRLTLKNLMAEYGLPTLKLSEVWPLPEKGVEKAWLPYPDTFIHDPIEIECEKVMADSTSAFWKYSELDIIYLKVLYEKLNKPNPDYNSTNCHNIAYVRYYGFDIDRKELEKAHKYYSSVVSSIEEKIQGVNLRSSKERLALLQPYFPLLQSTNKKVLKSLVKEGGEGGKLAAAMLEYGPCRQRLLQIEKVMESRTGKAHPDLRVMGTATNRMAGTSGLNWQGIGAVEEAEDIFDEPLEDYAEEDELPYELLDAWKENEQAEIHKTKVGLRQAILTPMVGDWSNFEVRLAAKIYEDEQMLDDLRQGLDVHSMLTRVAHPSVKGKGITYEEFEERRHNDLFLANCRKEMKAVVFGSFYFCTAHSVANTLGIEEREAQQILEDIYSRYPGMKRFRSMIEEMFCTADKETWEERSVGEMKTELTDLTGFTRRWNFEKNVACALWSLAKRSRIKTGLSGRVLRTQTKGFQSIDMACVSALLGSAIAIQAAVSRQAGNMKIQATGSSLHKMLQAILWERLRLPTLQVHDELFPPIHNNFDFEKVSDIIKAYEKAAAGIVPGLRFDFNKTERWGDK